jgi:glutathione S-transferase
VRTLYDAAGCWKCEDVREVLDRLALPYETIEVRGNPAARERLIALTGDRYVPVLVDGDLVVWDRRRIMRYLVDTYGAGGEGWELEEVPAWAGGARRIAGAADPGPSSGAGLRT